MSSRALVHSLLATLLVLAASAMADAQTPSSPAPPGGARPQSPVTVSTPGGEVTVISDQLEEVGAERLLVATGNVEVTRGPTRLLADRVELNRQTGDAVAIGRVIFYDAGSRMTGERLDYNVRTGTGVLHGGRVEAEPFYRIDGQRFERAGEGLYHVQRGVFTTCVAEPAPWSVHIGSADADIESHVFGTNASFWVRNFPLIPWFPFFAAALRNERQTGFLFPRLGQSSSKGFHIELPFFWAITDSQDLTASFLEYTNRGTGLTGHYRYVLSQQTSGFASGFWLKETERKNFDRGWLSVRHDSTFAPDWSFKADVRMVTDDNLFREYGDGLHQRSEQRAESNVFVTRRWPTWDLVTTWFWYQDVTTSRPVELNRLPEVSLQGSRQPVPGLPGVLYEFEGSATKFVREVGSDGSRVDLHPRLSRPFSLDGLATVTPFAGGRLTGYDRRVTGARISRGRLVEEVEEDDKLRRLVEAGVDFEATASRVYEMNGFFNLDRALHTIEPRVRYLWIDGRGKNNLPSWTDLDRIRNTESVEYSITNRIRGRTFTGPEAERIELMRFVLGHSIDFKRASGTSGDVFGDLILRPNQIVSLRSDVRHDTHGGGVRSSSTDVSLTLTRLLASIGLRYSDTPQKTTFMQGSLNGEITSNLTARVSTNWDIRNDRFLENRYAVDVKFQCWSFTIEAIDRNGKGRAGEDEIRIAVNLLGLGAPLTTSVGLGALTSGGGTAR